jgi:short-subunit dehydrogenase
MQKEKLSTKKYVIITGASRGMGKSMAMLFASRGYHLRLSARGEDALRKTAEEIISLNPDIQVIWKAEDLSNKEGAERLGEWLLEQNTPIDILINNAGTFVPGSVYNEPEGALDHMLSLNLYAAYHLTRKLLPLMMKQSDVDGSRGHIFNICSIAALKAYANGGAYSISKYALNGFSKNLREELKPYLIKVTTVFPGAVLTDSWGDFDNSSRRIMEADDIAKMVYAASCLTPQACVEEILIRPQLGDL